MKNIQRVIIAGILLLPVLLGIVILIIGSLGGGKNLTGGGFKKLGLVRVEGVIDKSYDIVKQLRLFRLDNSIAGVLLRVDSPGGATAPSQEIFAEVSRFNKPLVVSMGSLAASGGYYISSPASRIFADPGTLTGSIGVIMQIPLYQGLAKKIGVEMRILKAGKYKDMANSFRPMSDQERLILQSLLDDTHEQFISDVARSRGLEYDSVAAIADGRVFTGRQAIAVHLVDTLGGYEDALSFLREKTGLGPKAHLVREKRNFQHSANGLLMK